MTDRFFQFTIVALFAAFSAQAQVYGPPVYGPPPYDPNRDAAHSALVQQAAAIGTGKWWVKLPDEARDKFIERYTFAMNRVSSDLFKDCVDGAKSLPRIGAQEVDIVSNMIVCKVGSSFDFNFDRKEIREAVDEFYKDSTNLTIPVDVALQRVRETLAAKRPRSSGIGGVG